MEPRQAWGAFSIITILADAIVVAALLSYGFEPVLVGAIALIALLVYFYVVYKRYHVEVVPEEDIKKFEDPADLRILCTIYGLDPEGGETDIRNRLLDFARWNRDSAFIWIAPKAVQYFGAALEIPPPPRTTSARTVKSLLREGEDSELDLSRINKCPICDSMTSKEDSICKVCGADLRFYTRLQDSKVGRLVLSHKSEEVRRKLRYEVRELERDK